MCMYSQQHGQMEDIFTTLKRKAPLFTHWLSISLSLNSSPKQGLLYFLSLWINCFWTSHVNGLIIYSYVHWSFHLTQCSQDCSCYSKYHSFNPLSGQIFQCVDIPCFVCLFLVLRDFCCCCCCYSFSMILQYVNNHLYISFFFLAMGRNTAIIICTRAF